MKLSFLERYGFTIALCLITLFAWRMISTGIHTSPELRFLFPLYWLSFTPLSSSVNALNAQFGSAQWWMWMEVAFTVFGWLLIYFSVRGIFYSTMSMEGPSMWVAFGICLVVAIALVFLLLRPAFDQMAVWWTAWPKPDTPQLP
jgi:hypothetical protein